MRGLLIVSVLLGNLCIPLIAARERTLSRGVLKTLLLAAVLNGCYAIGIRYVYWFD